MDDSRSSDEKRLLANSMELTSNEPEQVADSSNDEIPEEKLAYLKEQLIAQIDQELEKNVKPRRSVNGILKTVIILLSLGLSATVTIAGIYDNATLAAVLGAILAAVLAIQNSWPFGKVNLFYRAGEAELENLKTSVLFKANTQEELESFVEQLTLIRRNIALDIPVGQGMNIIKKDDAD